MHFGVLNYEKQHKEGTCKVSGRSVVFSDFYADFCLCPKLLIITTLTTRNSRQLKRSISFLFTFNVFYKLCSLFIALLWGGGSPAVTLHHYDVMCLLERYA